LLLLTVLAVGLPRARAAAAGQRPPDIVIRLDQALFDSQAVRHDEHKALGDKVKDLSMQFKADGLHVSGRYHVFIIDPSFTAILDFVSAGPDTFDIQVREIKVSFVDVKILTKTILDAAQSRLDQALEGICTFQYVGKEDGSQVVRVKLDMAKLAPAFPGLSLTGIVVKDGELVLKAGKRD
jgi:hypothetical protein